MFLIFRNDGSDDIKSNIVCPIILFYFVIIDKFDPNPILININKLKAYRYIENITLQLVLANPSDLVIDEPIQTKELKPLPIENANFEHVEFELLNNYLKHVNIIGTYVLVHYRNHVLIEFNYVLNCNDQNDSFSENLIDICTLGVYNPKSHVYSSLQSCY
jgi:hypothetical protein